MVDLAALAALEAEIVACRRCPRLVEWRERVARDKVARFADEPYWGRPLPGFGDPQARVLIVGLAFHNLVMALLWRAGLRGTALTVVAAWKDVLLLAALARNAHRSRARDVRERVVYSFHLLMRGLWSTLRIHCQSSSPWLISA